MTSPASVRTDHDAARRLRDPNGPAACSGPTARDTRHYEAAALRADLTVVHVAVTAPALPVFEEATAAFARGTVLQTTLGPVAVEDLRPGDYVETTTGPEPVVWIGGTSFVPGVRSEGSALTGLTRVVEDALAPGRPDSDLILGPGARMMVENARLKTLIGLSRVLVPVSDYRDGERFVPVTPAGTVRLYHLATRRHALIRVGGMLMETYHPGTGIRRQLGEAHAETFLTLFPHLRGLDGFGELSLPRTSREVLENLGSR
ncbi:hypothetical protein OCH239_09505 [Roseivivax halodurans JCM 10272]|uniref:Hedgehog/Intein (Hint) domain-containing protein n=1 Tax=Roseivivax halodurans JCM 10272 TaxID=1449350 RepID=X7ECD2_9RHOB|nr:Hint domain-containing protein [Roseivivax halodurans]ETX13597.1 hypothetical protein OCH239_09505 [Roseivivax halodurans JCM 10272]